MVRKAFEFKKSYEEVEIGDKTYQVDFSDTAVGGYHKSFEHFYKESQRIKVVETKGMPTKEQEKLFKEMQELVKGMVEELLGEGTYEELYEASGHSLINMMDLIQYLGEVIDGITQEINKKRKEKYLVGKK